jgi:hypothetical protein
VRRTMTVDQVAEEMFKIFDTMEGDAEEQAMSELHERVNNSDIEAAAFAIAIRRISEKRSHDGARIEALQRFEHFEPEGFGSASLKRPQPGAGHGAAYRSGVRAR